MWKFIKYECKYWLKAPMTWIFFAIVSLLVFGAVASDYINIGGGVGNVHKNAPFTVQSYYGVMSLICLFFTTAYMNSTANRDFEYGMYQLVFASPIRKRDYFFGKFIGAYLMSIIPILGVSVGTIIGPLLSSLPADRFGAFSWNGHIMGLLGFALPNIFIAGVMIYSLAVIFRSTTVSFIGVMLILVLWALSMQFTEDIQKEWLANILDPFGFRPESVLSKYNTVSEKNLHATPLTGPFLYNRLAWVAVSTVMLLLLYTRFSFSARKASDRTAKTEDKQIKYIPVKTAFIPASANRLSLKLLLNLIVFETKAVIRNPVFIIIASIGIINLVTDLTSVTGVYGDTQYPVTYFIVDNITGSFYIFLIAIITFYSGVLVWRDRDAKINEIQDASAVKTGMLFTSKFFALILTVALVLALNIVTGMIIQACYGYYRFQLDVYVKSILVLDLLRFSYLTVAALLFHYLINNRYIAYFAFIAFIILNAFLWSALQVRTNMVQFGATPSSIYSDMNGFGPYVKGLTWFNIYWVLFSVLLTFLAYGFYIRGKEYAFAFRFREAMARMKRNLAAISICAVLFILCSGFVYYNTFIENQFKNSKESEQASIDYEKAYKKYEFMPQPRYYAIEYKIDLHPAVRSMSGTITAWVKNISSVPVKELYFSMPLHIKNMEIHVENSQVKLDDAAHKFRIMSLNQPIAPGDSMKIVYTFTKNSPGFENEVSFTELNQNGTFFNSTDILPVIGYNRDYEIESKNTRKKYNLPLRERMPRLDESNIAARMNNYISNDADWVNVTTTISTDSDQVAIAPGSLRKTWTENDRKYFIYTLDKESVNFYSFLSARYEIARRKWNGIDIEVYYDKAHGVNVPNMLNSVEKSLSYYTTNFGPYFHKQCRIIEFPRYATFAQSFPGTMPYSEGIGFITDLRNVTKDDIDFVYYVVAHEMAHQYWAHQLIGAQMQGSEMMSEGFAQYSALMVMEKAYGKDKMKKFLKYEMNGYLSGRSGDLEGENPIIKTEGQQYIHYQKASVVLYYLKEMIGEDKLNGALRSLLDSFAYKNPPYATSLSALRALKAATPDSLQYLITDMFENITLFSNRVLEATAQKDGDGYVVTIKTKSEKFRSDSLGKETAIPVNDYIDIGIFGKSQQKDALGAPLILTRVKVKQKENTYTYRVKEKPYQAGIDPYNYLIDRVPDDNVKSID